MDGPQTLLITWAWERMPWIAPIPRHELNPPHVPLAKRYDTEHYDDVESLAQAQRL
ncbi:hypothetical protein PIB30_002877 [Stylosanthes scabra]|uniref:Uncharacterized protein n=1 Tax=Stylosanthes scabra TaxID=79078 RepID=A0ABU6U1X2_9FABA|nr:hypothetical protein [Stylosanthes scabra]